MSTQHTHYEPGFCYCWSWQEFSLELFVSCLFSLALAILSLLHRYVVHGHFYASIIHTHTHYTDHDDIPLYLLWTWTTLIFLLPSARGGQLWHPDAPQHWSASVSFSSCPLIAHFIHHCIYSPSRANCGIDSTKAQFLYLNTFKCMNDWEQGGAWHVLTPSLDECKMIFL